MCNMHPSDAIAIRPHHRRARAAPAQQPAPERRSAIRAGFQPAGLLTFLALLLFPLFSRASDSTSVEAILFIGNDNTRFVAVWSDLDQLVMPQRNARITHPDLNARNVLFRGIGHMSLPVDGRVAHEIAQALSLIDSEGNPVDITSIA